MNSASGNQRILEEIGKAVVSRNEPVTDSLIEQALSSGIDAAHVRDALVSGLDASRKSFMTKRLYLPEFILTIDSVTRGLEKVSSMSYASSTVGIPLVIGVVEGDPHELGKNIIARVYLAYGYRVIDLGRDVPKKSFIDAVEKHEAKILALSAMMSTTMPVMEDIIRDARRYFNNLAVIVGGAPLDNAIAQAYGADGFAPSAVTVIEETRSACERIFPWIL
jgi:methanogenic corrinoid protein MtbC1